MTHSPYMMAHSHVDSRSRRFDFQRAPGTHVTHIHVSRARIHIKMNLRLADLRCQLGEAVVGA